MNAELTSLHEAIVAIPCPRCDAPVGARCVNPVTGLRARIPCVARLHNFEGIPAVSPLPVAEAAPKQPDRSLDASGDRWVHAYLTTRPQTVARLATELDATTGAIESALERLQWDGHAHRHPDGWSLPSEKEVAA
jgi:hypothetical protein